MLETHLNIELSEMYCVVDVIKLVVGAGFSSFL